MSSSTDGDASGGSNLDLSFSDKPQDEPHQKKMKFDKDKEQDVCPICLQTLDMDIFQHGCKHQFHTKCFIEYVEISKEIGNCPVCRVEGDLEKFLKLSAKCFVMYGRGLIAFRPVNTVILLPANDAPPDHVLVECCYVQQQRRQDDEWPLASRLAMDYDGRGCYSCPCCMRTTSIAAMRLPPKDERPICPSHGVCSIQYYWDCNGFPRKMYICTHQPDLRSQPYQFDCFMPLCFRANAVSNFRARSSMVWRKLWKYSHFELMDWLPSSGPPHVWEREEDGNVLEPIAESFLERWIAESLLRGP